MTALPPPDLPGLIPQWPAPNTVHAFSTTRGPHTKPQLTDFGNKQSTTAREHLQQCLQLPSAPFWLQQQHQTHILSLDNFPSSKSADGTICHTAGKVCVILTADCLPILLCNRQGTEVAAIHVGWRGLLAGIIDQAIQQCHSEPHDMLAWLGPCIGPEAFEVEVKIRNQFIQRHLAWHTGFKQSSEHHCLADLHALATTNLQACGLDAIYTEPACTHNNPHLFYSYRRDGQHTGRMAHLIWLAQPRR